MSRDREWDDLFGVNEYNVNDTLSGVCDDIDPEGLIFLERSYLDSGTYGVLLLPNGYRCLTVERPWQDNMNKVSCIPEGEYTLRKRTSPLIQRLTNGDYQQGWEVTNVENRTFIMIHQANVPSELEGCIGMGESFFWFKGQLGVSNSRNTFDKLMEQLEVRDEWTLVITTRTI